MTTTIFTMHDHMPKVFYRDWTDSTTRQLCVTGWVRNLSDGTVEAHRKSDADHIETAASNH